eukprot:TRINITY_DN3276_c0_g3_i2.p2 TRINITY_DN3276_c0_g3~~TRINITY_DN3276_c0_g3_i2.p2  ORF type:complete len:171 (-),score=12.57 TRINITY_DN3276_c0_g3_i2:303-815(-)
MIKKFFHVLFQLMEDISYHVVLINALSSGTSRVNAETHLKTITIKIGFQKSDISLSQQKAVLLDNILHQLDGTDILKSGTIKLSTSKTASKLMMLISMPSLFPQEEITLLQEVKILKSVSLISMMLTKTLEHMMYQPQSMDWPSTLNTIGLPSVPKPDGKSGTSNQKIHL